MSADIWDTSGGSPAWLNLATSEALPVVANDVHSLLVSRTSGAWYVELNGVEYTITKNADGNFIIPAAAEIDIMVDSSGTDAIYLRQIRFSSGTEDLFNFVFDLSADGYFSNNGNRIQTQAQVSVMTMTMAAFRDYSLEKVLEDYVNSKTIS